MITPLGVGYAMRMLADVTKGPFEPLLGLLGFQIGSGLPTRGQHDL